MSKNKLAGQTPAVSASRNDIRERIIKAALGVLKKGGREALTTRSVSAAAKVQAPTLYRLFGDMRGLFDAVAESGFVAAFNKKKEQKPSSDPVEDLRRAWDSHINFGLENPVLYVLMFGEPRPELNLPVIEKSKQLLGELIHRIAVEGQLKVTEKRAAELIYSFSSGIVLSLLAMPEEIRDINLSYDAREVVVSAITNHDPLQKNASSEIVSAAITMQALLPSVSSLSEGERHLLKELLDRIATQK